MGSNINGFEVRLKFDAAGKVEEAHYSDSDGCGHSKPFTVGVGSMTTLQEVIDYHLGHYKRSHEMVPPKFCGKEFRDDSTGLEVTYECQEAPHPKYPMAHVLTIKKVEGDLPT